MSEQPLRPRDAATLILVRTRPSGPEVLMGERSAAHVFVPGNYVFPGGRVDRSDAFVAPATPLREAVLQRLTASCTPRRAQALALAAVRETFEETGIILGQPANGAGPQRAPKGWEHYFSTGMVPALDRLTYVARAITPTGRPRRFNARFFVTDVDSVDTAHAGSGELEKLHWFSIPDAMQLKIRPITKLVLAEIERRIVEDGLHDDDRPVPAWRVVRGERQITYE